MTTRTRSLAARLVMSLALIAAGSGFVALGTWQVQRLAWKQDLIARVDERVHAPPVAPPAREQWSTVNEEQDEYRRVQVTGRFITAADIRVQAVTRLGAGFWVLTPLITDEDAVIWINRGFVPQEAAAQDLSPHDPQATVTITGLLRISEPDGAFLRENLPDQQRWYSRDVAAMSKTLGLSATAPYFIDQQAQATQTWPRGGLTVIQFPDNHRVYALTWFALALMCALALAALWRPQWPSALRRQLARVTARDRHAQPSPGKHRPQRT